MSQREICEHLWRHHEDCGSGRHKQSWRATACEDEVLVGKMTRKHNKAPSILVDKGCLLAVRELLNGYDGHMFSAPPTSSTMSSTI